MNKVRAFYVYVIGPDGSYPCKVGVAIDVTKRLATLQTSHWEQLYLYETIWMPNRSMAYKVEKIIKKRLKAYNARGEWFNVFAADMVKELKNIQLELEKSSHARNAALISIDKLETYLD